VTASVTAALVESSRRRYTAQADADFARQLTELNERLARIETALSRSPSLRPPDGVD
jgi:hypothetical protein